MAKGTSTIGEADLQIFLVGYDPQLRRYLQRRVVGELKRAFSPEDIIQETWVAAFRNRSRACLSGPSDLERWVTAIAKTRLIDSIRSYRCLKRAGSHKLVEEFDLSSSSFLAIFDRCAPWKRTPSQDVSTKEATEAVKSALKDLPHERQLAIWMRYIEGQPVSVIAKNLSKTTAAVRGLIFHGLRELRDRMGNAGKFFSDATSGERDPVAANPSDRNRREAI